MRKYLYILKTVFKDNIQYIVDFCVSFISFALIIYIFLNLWQYMYDDPNSLINGYTMNQMVWYVLGTELLWMGLGGRSICAAISKDVKDGNIAYKINKPYNYILYILSNYMGRFIIKFIVYTILGLILGYLLLGSFPTLNVLQIIIVIISCLLATVVSILLVTSIGLLAFFIEDSAPLYWVYSKVILVVGTLFPIEFFPKVIRPFLDYSPIHAVAYGPAKLFVNFDYNFCLKVFIIQIVYVIISYTLCSLIYRKGVKNINVNGG